MTKEKAIDVLRNIGTEIDDFCHGAKHWRDKDKEELEALDMAIKALNYQPKEGEWIELGQNKDETHNIRCKACGAAFKSRGHANSYYTKKRFRFCLYCGAKMKGTK